MSNIKGEKIWEGRFPHCDQRVLHAPGECKFCDDCSLLQFVRHAWGINFTGHHQIETDNGTAMLPCPAEVSRPLDLINRWGGNTARTVAQVTKDEAQMKKDMEKLVSDVIAKFRKAGEGG